MAYDFGMRIKNSSDGYVCGVNEIEGLEEELDSINTSIDNVIKSGTCIVHDALTNVNGYSLSGSYSATDTTISANNTTYNVIIIKTQDGNKLTTDQAATYMKRQTGSYFLPVYTQDNPSFAYLIFNNGKIYKAQWDDTNGLVLWYCNQLLLKSDVTNTLYLHKLYLQARDENNKYYWIAGYYYSPKSTAYTFYNLEGRKRLSKVLVMFHPHLYMSDGINFQVAITNSNNYDNRDVSQAWQNLGGVYIFDIYNFWFNIDDDDGITVAYVSYYYYTRNDQEYINRGSGNKRLLITSVYDSIVTLNSNSGLL